MLILTRKTQEALTLNDNITITVLSIKENRVRLGIDAPRDVNVYREELYDDKDAQEVRRLLDQSPDY